jgi:hypothetical protein
MPPVSPAMNKNKYRELGSHVITAVTAVMFYMLLERWDAIKALVGRLFN